MIWGCSQKILKVLKIKDPSRGLFIIKLLLTLTITLKLGNLTIDKIIHKINEFSTQHKQLMNQLNYYINLLETVYLLFTLPKAK